MAMVVTLESLTMGVPVLALANDQPVAGFIVKSSICLLISGATVGLIFLPKVAMAYGWGVIEGESNPWRFVKGDSSGSNNAASKSAPGKPVANGSVAPQNPSLQSLVSGKVLVSSTSPSISNPGFHVAQSRAGHRAHSKEFERAQSNNFEKHRSLPKDAHAVVSSTSAQLKAVLDSDPIRRRFRRYLQTLRMDENVRFWDCITVHRLETDPLKRAVSARAVIQTFVLDSAPLQVNLSSPTKQMLIAAYTANDKEKLGSEDLFQGAMDELFNDLRQSDAFRVFLENDTFSTVKLSLSDTNVVS
jgi:hypothetical protein